jgi:hypothetical protein
MLEELDNETISRMIKSQKLTLVLDLDHTLLHAVQSAHVIDSLDNYGTVTLE